MTEQLKVGDILWTRDSRANRPSWEAHMITGETRASWLIKVPGWERKVLKRDLMESLGKYGHQRWYTLAEKEGVEWRKLHHGPIVTKVQHATDNQLREIAKIVGYEIEP